MRKCVGNGVHTMSSGIGRLNSYRTQIMSSVPRAHVHFVLLASYVNVRLLHHVRLKKKKIFVRPYGECTCCAKCDTLNNMHFMHTKKYDGVRWCDLYRPVRGCCVYCMHSLFLSHCTRICAHVSSRCAWWFVDGACVSVTRPRDIRSGITSNEWQANNTNTIHITRTYRWVYIMIVMELHTLACAMRWGLLFIILLCFVVFYLWINRRTFRSRLCECLCMCVYALRT